MNNECKNSDKNIKTFFGNFDRIIVLCFCLISFILNLTIIISIFLNKGKKISVIIRLTASILLVNFINIFSYTFQWVICKSESNSNNSYNILLLVENTNNFIACKLQSFILLASSLSQDYLIILFFFIVNRKNMIKVSFINLFSFISILVPILISFLCLLKDVFGINDDFCYLKKFEFQEKEHNYSYFDNYKYNFLGVYFLRGINFAISILFLIKIMNYLKKEKSIYYILNKLSMLFIQLFKLFIILSYRILTLFINKKNSIFSQIYIILSTIDGLLLPLAFCFSNNIFKNCLQIGKKSRRSTIDEKDSEDEIMPPLHMLTKEDDVKNSTKTVMYNNSNNFDLSY